MSPARLSKSFYLFFVSSFFFSSRRRHTRWPRDWSSDVCSSDLSWQFGSFLIIFGSLLWAGNFQLIDFSFIDIWKLWPLILIYLGTNMLFGKSSIIITYEHDTDKSDKKKFKNGEVDFDDFDIFDEKIDGSYKSKKKGTYNYHFKTKNKFVTDMNFSNNNWEVQPMDLWTGVGDLYFDFSKAYIPYKETHIK